MTSCEKGPPIKRRIYYTKPYSFVFNTEKSNPLEKHCSCTETVLRCPKYHHIWLLSQLNDDSSSAVGQSTTIAPSTEVSAQNSAVRQIRNYQKDKVPYFFTDEIFPVDQLTITLNICKLYCHFIYRKVILNMKNKMQNMPLNN